MVLILLYLFFDSIICTWKSLGIQLSRNNCDVTKWWSTTQFTTLVLWQQLLWKMKEKKKKKKKKKRIIFSIIQNGSHIHDLYYLSILVCWSLSQSFVIYIRLGNIFPTIIQSTFIIIVVAFCILICWLHEYIWLCWLGRCTFLNSLAFYFLIWLFLHSPSSWCEYWRHPTCQGEMMLWLSKCFGKQICWVVDL